MWSRANFKQQAKNALTNNYWLSFGVCILAGIITGVVSYISNLMSSSVRVFFNIGDTDMYSGAPNMFMDGTSASIIIGFVMIFILFFTVLEIAASIFLSCPIMVGENKFFLESRKGHRNFDNLFSSFKNGRYMGVIKGMAWMILFTFLWTLCFYIPGIIKSYSYSMVPYILADNPDIGYRRAIKLSMKMTDGYKWHIFVLQLSFIGWYMLGALCCGIGVIFVTPYFMATNSEMYAFLRKNAIEKGFCNPTELNLTQEDAMLDYPSQPNY